MQYLQQIKKFSPYLNLKIVLFKKARIRVQEHMKDPKLEQLIMLVKARPLLYDCTLDLKKRTAM